MPVPRLRRSVKGADPLVERDDRTADAWERLDALLAQMDQIPDLPNAFDPLEWDEHGLPR